LQLATPFGGVGQSPALQQPVVGMQTLPHALYPLLQAKPHAPLAQVGLAFAGAVQSVGWQQAPVAMHDEPHFCNPAPQVKSHIVPSQVAVALAGGCPHGEHEVPQLKMLMLLAQVPLQLW
jgi:hypothetical protein